MLIHYFKELLKDKKLMKDCLTLAIPMMLQQLVIASVNLVDNLMVGKLGDIAFSGVASANKYYNIILFAINAMVASSTIFLAQYNGAKNTDKMKETYRFSIISSYVIIIITFIIVCLFPNQLLKFIIDDKEIINTGVEYIKIACLSYLPIGISISAGSAMRSIGDAKTPMYISISAIFVNAILDYALIFGKLGLPQMGVKGAALATFIARIIEMCLYILISRKLKYDYHTRIRDLFKFSKELSTGILNKAYPLLINEVAWQFGMTVLFKAYSSRGSIINTAYSAASTVSDIFFVLFSGMAVASTVLIGTPLGANKLEEGKANGYKLLCFAVLLSFVFGVGMYSSNFLIPIIYSDISLESIHTAQTFLKVMGCCFWLYTFNCQCYFILRAGGDTKSTMFMDSGYMWLVNVPFVLFLAYKTNLNIYLVYICCQLTDVIKLFIAFSFVRKNKWVVNLATKN